MNPCFSVLGMQFYMIAAVDSRYMPPNTIPCTQNRVVHPKLPNPRLAIFLFWVYQFHGTGTAVIASSSVWC